MKFDPKIPWFAACVIASVLCTTSTAIAEGADNKGAVTIVDKLSFPEGPLFVNGEPFNHPNDIVYVTWARPAFDLVGPGWHQG